MGFHSIISDFSSGTSRARFFDFQKKVHTLRILWGNALITFWVLKSTDIQKLILQSFRSVKIYTFSYSSHENPMRTRWDRVGKKAFSNFLLVGVLPY